MQELSNFISSQPADFRVDWTFTGTVHFIQTDERLAAERDKLLPLFAALGAPDRAAILEALRTATVSFQ
jgi:hypothetical protein